VRLLQRGRRQPRVKTIRPAERYLLAGTEEARRLGHNYVGTEHVLSVLIRDPDGRATRVLAALDVTTDSVKRELACWLGDTPEDAKIDPHALATLGIDFEAVRARLERTFGPGALERTRSGCLGICPRLKMALASSLAQAGHERLRDEHVLLGLLSTPGSVAARVLGKLGVSPADVQAAVDAEP